MMADAAENTPPSKYSECTELPGKHGDSAACEDSTANAGSEDSLTSAFAGESSHAAESPRLPGSSAHSECVDGNANGEGGEAQDDQLLSRLFMMEMQDDQIKKLKQERDDMFAKVSKLEQQRDDLIAALKSNADKDEQICALQKQLRKWKGESSIGSGNKRTSIPYSNSHAHCKKARTPANRQFSGVSVDDDNLMEMQSLPSVQRKTGENKVPYDAERRSDAANTRNSDKSYKWWKNWQSIYLPGILPESMCDASEVITEAEKETMESMLDRLVDKEGFPIETFKKDRLIPVVEESVGKTKKSWTEFFAETVVALEKDPLYCRVRKKALKDYVASEKERIKGMELPKEDNKQSLDKLNYVEKQRKDDMLLSPDIEHDCPYCKSCFIQRSVCVRKESCDEHE